MRVVLRRVGESVVNNQVFWGLRTRKDLKDGWTLDGSMRRLLSSYFKLRRANSGDVGTQLLQLTFSSFV